MPFHPYAPCVCTAVMVVAGAAAAVVVVEVVVLENNNEPRDTHMNFQLEKLFFEHTLLVINLFVIGKYVVDMLARDVRFKPTHSISNPSICRMRVARTHLYHKNKPNHTISNCIQRHNMNGCFLGCCCFFKIVDPLMYAFGCKARRTTQTYTLARSLTSDTFQSKCLSYSCATLRFWLLFIWRSSSSSVSRHRSTLSSLLSLLKLRDATNV